MSEEVTIPKKEYEFLVKCREILSIESDGDFKPEFLEKLNKAEKEIKAGKGVVRPEKRSINTLWKTAPPKKPDRQTSIATHY